jgi:hypothetical protein
MAHPYQHHAVAIARAVRAGDEPAAEAARRLFYEGRIAHFIETTLAKAPPLRPEQIERLRAKLGAAPSAREAA